MLRKTANLNTVKNKTLQKIASGIKAEHKKMHTATHYQRLEDIQSARSVAASLQV
jgi:hypothetical protein